MADKETGGKITQRRFSGRAAYRRFKTGVQRMYRDLALGLRWTLIIFASLAVLASLSLSVSGLVSPSSSKKQQSKDTVVNAVSLRLHQISEAISHVRDSVSIDSVFVEEIKSEAQQSILFETIHKLDSLKDSRFAEILSPLNNNKYSFLKGRGVAYYDNTKRLTAWSSSKEGTANFDSVFSYASLLEKHSKSIFIGSEQMFSWVISIRKMISHDGALLGYVVAKAMIGERFPITQPEEHPLTIFEDIIARSGRDIRFAFSSLRSDSAVTKNIYPVYLDVNDSTSIAGYLNISDTAVLRQIPIERTLRFIRDLFFVLFIILLTWLLSWFLAESGCKEKTFSLKLFYLSNISIILFLGRVILLQTDSLSAIIPQSFQDPQDFALPIGFGLFSDPLQLFTTIFFFTSFLVLGWVIFVPQRADWNTTAQPDDEKEVFSTTGWLFKVLSIICLVLLFPAINYLFASIVSILVENGSYHFIGNRFGFTRGPFILMEASFLLIGVSYFFSSLSLLLWCLRSMIRLTASELSPSRSYLTHYIFFIIIATISGWLLSPNVLNIYHEIYWPIICFALCIITVILYSRDVAALQTGHKVDSFFYRIPRSGLALLFLLTGAGFILSPLVATREYNTDIEIIKQSLKQNSQVNDLTYSSILDQIFISLTGDAEAIPSLVTSSDINNLAFNIWLKQFPEAQNRNIVIELHDINGRLLSHFAQNARLEDEKRLGKISDSLSDVLKTLNNDNVAPYLLASAPCFTASCTPASVGVGYLALPNFKDHTSHLQDSLLKAKFVISISLWDDLFPQEQTHSLYDIVRTSGTSGDKLNWQDQDVYYAEYQYSSLQNSSTSTVELPSHISPLIDTALTNNEFVSREAQTEGNRSFTIYHKINEEGGNAGRIMAATIVMPGINSLLGLALSFNTVSLFIGFFVIFFVLMVRSLFSKGKRGTLKFRDRIFLIVLTIALVPLVIVTNITKSLLIEREQRIEREHLQRDAGVIAERLQRTFSGPDTISSGHLSATLGDLARTIGRDISYYNSRGILFATNRPELYESSFLASQLSSETFRNIFSGQKSFTIEPLTSGSGSFDIGYKVVQNTVSGDLSGVVGITSFRGAQIIEADIARTIELMYGAFAALGIVLLLIGAWISVRVATPLQQLISATEQVTEGRLETIVNIKRKDEVGELAQAFNKMTSELERTRENVAQSEREGAWKEMARQVAHEIKNPLTPMKLSVQHVEHAYETGDTNFGSVFRRVIRTLSEQIDVLTRIATEFSRFGEMPRRKYGFVSLRKIAESAMALYDADRGRIRFVIDIPKNLPPIYADDEEFRRALVNLIRNSLQATDGWGIILIRAREKSGLIHLTLSDTGGGMTQETLKKAFDPNFSTKTSGMGLGLAIVKKIITDMSGTISVESTLGKGTVFHIELPAREYPAA